MYTNNKPIKKGFVFFKSDLCARDFVTGYPKKYQVQRRGGLGYFCRVDPEEYVNGCQVVTITEYQEED